MYGHRIHSTQLSNFEEPPDNSIIQRSKFANKEADSRDTFLTDIEREFEEGSAKEPVILDEVSALNDEVVGDMCGSVFFDSARAAALESLAEEQQRPNELKSFLRSQEEARRRRIGEVLEKMLARFADGESFGGKGNALTKNGQAYSHVERLEGEKCVQEEHVLWACEDALRGERGETGRGGLEADTTNVFTSF